MGPSSSGECCTTRPDPNFYFNNGVTAVCTDFEFDPQNPNELIAKNFQIINGAQTVGALASAKPQPDIEVLFRLIKTSSVKTEKGVNSDIIRFNNTQNIIKISDFRSNDPIQLWLEQEFSRLKPMGALPLLRYVRKRSFVRRGPERVLKLEELAKLRYAFLYEPTVILASPKDLYAFGEDKGAYEKAFGFEDSVCDTWPEEEFRRLLMGIAFYLRIEEVCKREVATDSSLFFLQRLRYHALSLAGTYMRGKLGGMDLQKLLRDSQLFDGVWQGFWPEAKRVLIDAYLDAKENQATLYALCRNIDRWNRMKKRFQMYIGVKD